MICLILTYVLFGLFFLVGYLLGIRQGEKRKLQKDS